MNRFGYAAGILVTGLLLSAGSAFAQSQLNPKTLEAACAVAAKAEPATFRPGGNTKMWCAVVDREGKLLAINATDTGGTPQNPLGSDAWRGSIEIAIAKAYTAVAFSSNDLALDIRGGLLISHIRSIDIAARPVRYAGAAVPAVVAQMVRAKLDTFITI